MQQSTHRIKEKLLQMQRKEWDFVRIIRKIVTSDAISFPTLKYTQNWPFQVHEDLLDYLWCPLLSRCCPVSATILFPIQTICSRNLSYSTQYTEQGHLADLSITIWSSIQIISQLYSQKLEKVVSFLTSLLWKSLDQRKYFFWIFYNISPIFVTLSKKSTGGMIAATCVMFVFRTAAIFCVSQTFSASKQTQQLKITIIPSQMEV